ncbi:MAG: ATP-binding cassette domain-containing protein [Syntrophaceae bacterium]|nr:ATP-binding cassette domain-containing protein [Syntrophaceae bacterium]
MLEIKNLMVFHENALALNDFSLELSKGEFVSVLGSNSAGKSTLMNSLAGLLEYKRIKEKRRGGVRITMLGEIWFQGKNITGTKARQRVRDGIVLARERHPIFRDSDVVENLKIAGYLYKNDDVKERSYFVFHLFPQLERWKKKKAGFLSGGEQQMLIIGMALVANPILLLLDEPLLGLSPALQGHLVEAIKRINQKGITLLVAEQFARPLLPHIDRGYILENGMLTLTGTGEELMDNPEVKSAYFGV